MAKIQYIPINPKKYAGDVNNIYGRSSWEISFMKMVDTNPNIVQWMCEPKHLNIKYQNPLKKKVCSYWPDFLIKYANGVIELIEIKPFKETVLTENSTQYDKLMLVQNHSKWAAAKVFCDKRKINFRVITEKQLFKK